MRSFRLATIASCTALAAVLSACASRPVVVNSYPQVATPAPAIVTVPVAAVEYGRITNIEFFQADAPRAGVNVPGAVVGGLVGAAAGNALSGGRDAATVLGGAAGAVVGSQVGRGPATAGVYRITIQSETAGWRTFDVPATGDLRIGDRVRVDNGVITRA
ncbi:MAG: glycine zipper 2TM domain-containing protein [Pseudomonadota bacterium]